MRGSGWDRIVDGEAVVALGDIRRHVGEQTARHLTGGAVAIKRARKCAQRVSHISVSRHAGRDSVLVVGLAHINGFGGTRAVAGLRRVYGDPDALDHLVGQVHAGKRDNAHIVVAALVILLTGRTAFGVGRRTGLSGTQRRAVCCCCRHMISFPGVSRYKSGRDCRCSEAQRQTCR